MSREISRSRTHSPVDGDVQRILNLDSSPGSSRKHGEEGADEGIHVPNFSKEISFDSEEDPINQAVNTNFVKQSDTQARTHLVTPVEIPKNISPKGILKRRIPEQKYNIGVTETREKTKCCHPLVNKIKHLADKTLHKLEKSDNEKSPLSKRKQNEESQEIRQLKSSPSAVKRQKFSAIKLGSSDEMSKTMSIDTPQSRKTKEHIYEDIEETKVLDAEKSLHFSPEVETRNYEYESRGNNNKENESIPEKKSNASQDPSLVAESVSLKSQDHVMEKLHKVDNINKEALLLDEEMDPDEPNVDEIFQNQFDERGPTNESPNIMITEITNDDSEVHGEQSTVIPIESSPSPSPHDNEKRNNDEKADNEWSKPSSDHEYEIIEKPPPNIIYTAPSIDEKPKLIKTDDELSSTTSLERKYLQHVSDEDLAAEKEDQHDDENQDVLSAEALQSNIEERYFVNTPSSASRTECEVSTSQVDSSALEQLPLKRDSRSKNADATDNKLQQRIKESTGKLRTQAGKLKTKIQSIKVKQFTMPDKSKINLPERSRFKMPDRPRFSLPERRKFSLPDRPKFKKINISERLNFGDRKKFSLPERPKFSIPELPKFKMPDRPKINFPSLGRKKEYKIETETSDSTNDLGNVATVDFEAKTYPRLFSRKKKSGLPKTSSSPTLNREDTPPPTFTFTRMKRTKDDSTPYIPDSPEQPREYGNMNNDNPNFEGEMEERQFDRTYDFDKLDSEYMEDELEPSNLNENRTTTSTPDISPSNQEHMHVINEINNDEFFVRPRGISRENIQVREYLSDEIRQAFKIPKNALALMGSDSMLNDENVYANEPEADPDLMIDENDQIRYSSEDLNDKDDGYYTFPPIRPSRVKRKKKETESIKYIDDSVNASMQFSEVDLGLPEDHADDENMDGEVVDECLSEIDNRINFTPTTDLHSIHEYANDEVIQYPETMPIQSQTLPMPPKRKKKFSNKDFRHSSLNDFKNSSVAELWEEPQKQKHSDNVIVYRTEHEYIVPQAEAPITEPSPVAPRRNRSRSSRGTSICDDDRTSHGAESLTLDTHIAHADDVGVERKIRHESPGYATVDKGSYAPIEGIRRTKKNKLPERCRKSCSSERNYYTVGSTKNIGPDRPPRKKSSTSLITLDSFSKHSVSEDLTQYVEIDEAFENVHKNLKSGEVVNKMKDRPLPPPPRPPRGGRRNGKDKQSSNNLDAVIPIEMFSSYLQDEEIVEIEASTQTDPLPDDIDFEFGMDDNLDMSISSSLRDIVDDESILSKSHTKLGENPRVSRPTSRSQKSLKFSDPKISELSKPNIGRTSPTVILVERRVSSPTRINERDEMLTEASLTVQHIDIDESQIPDVPPLPRPRGVLNPKKATSSTMERVLDREADLNREVHLDNLVTQRLQVRDLDVGRLNVSELQANKILVSDIEGMTLQVTELDSKSGHISVSGIEFSQTVIDEIVKKFAEISTSSSHQFPSQRQDYTEIPRTVSTEQTQTDEPPFPPTERPVPPTEPPFPPTEPPVPPTGPPVPPTEPPVPPTEPPLPPKEPPTTKTPEIIEIPNVRTSIEEVVTQPPHPPSSPTSFDDGMVPPLRPPPPDLTPLLYSYLQDISIPPASFHLSRSFRDRPCSDSHEPQHQSPPPPTRRAKRKSAPRHSESSSDNEKLRPSPRRVPPSVRPHEPTITEAGAQFLRVCHSSISRTIRNIFNSFMTYISGTEDKKDVQMALVIFLVLIAGLIMFGLSDSRTIHHHHWEFFNPPDGKE